MLVSELKPLEEILGYLGDEKNIFIVGCKGCAEACETGGEKSVLEMKKKLEDAGKKITGYCIIDFLCDKALTKLRLATWTDRILDSDSLLIMSCGVGVQVASAVVDKVCHPATNTLSLGGRQGEWRGEERCAECGDCLLDYTGGICPITACTKGLINGPCGGSKDGKCEHQPDVRDCGWKLIYERLKKLGRLDKLREIVPPKNFARAEPQKRLRNTSLWALELEAKQPEVEQVETS
ncbi:MAG: 5,10-methylenetetrahydrofolate reductase [Methanobacteriota archaeon]|nr:MAG: 5,10-methylenetetrahydrofolate reductase [Euryarchaeota archaeon]